MNAQISVIAQPADECTSRCFEVSDRVKSRGTYND